MFGNILWLLVCWGCAAIFTGIGIHAGKMEKPIWFWSGTTVDSETITDIPAYNRANKRMWLLFSIPFWVTGVTYIWFPIISAIIMCFFAVGGMIGLMLAYQRIEKKYRR